MPTPENLILSELLADKAGWVSGAALAERLGVSRVSVWQHMKKLRAQGFVFEAQRARGYRLAAPPPGLHAGLIELQLKVRPRGFSLLVLDEIDSTNDEAARQLGAGRPAPFAVLARRQTRGRGRFGRAWHSGDSGNLYASFAFRPRVAPDRMQTFTLWMGVNLCELVANFTGLTPGLKWPNDIVFDGRKAGGMLTEARVDADQIRDLVFGLGLNVNGSSAGWPGDLPKRAAALADLTGAPLDPQPAHRGDHRTGAARLRALRRGGAAEELRRALAPLRRPARAAGHRPRGHAAAHRHGDRDRRPGRPPPAR